MQNTRFRSIAALLFIACAGMSACSNTDEMSLGPSAGGSGATALTAGQLTGTWTLVSLQTMGGPMQAAPAGATYTLTIADDRVSARADCNTCGGAFRLSGAATTVGLLACTRARCPTMQFEAVFESLLSGDSTATLIGNTLTLSSSRGTLTFVR
jgi:heat shock protein HslJ